VHRNTLQSQKLNANTGITLFPTVLVTQKLELRNQKISTWNGTKLSRSKQIQKLQIQRHELEKLQNRITNPSKTNSTPNENSSMSCPTATSLQHIHRRTPAEQ
jgi:hypothetical protein